MFSFTLVSTDSWLFKRRMILAVVNVIFMQLRKDDLKRNSGLQRGLNPWPRDAGAMLRTMNFLQASLRNSINCVHNCEDQ